MCREAKAPPNLSSRVVRAKIRERPPISLMQETQVPTDRPERTLHLSNALESRRRDDLLRTLHGHRLVEAAPRIVRNRATLLNFSSNDYLGLAMDLRVREDAATFARRYGGGSTASRLVSGNLEIHEGLERKLAAFTRRESALLFNSGYQANITLLPALVGRGGLIVCDRLCHNSLIQGALLSQARFLRFRHNDPGHLDEILSTPESRGASPVLVVTESIFSMDGDRAPIAEIASVAEDHGAFLMVDDAHAFGVWGNGGEGLAAANPRVDILVGTFGKALGSSGAFVAGSDLLRSFLVNFCGGFIYSTAPAPATIGAAGVALDLIESGELNLPEYLMLVERAHKLLQDAGFDTSPSTTQVIPIEFGAEAEALECATFLEEKGFLVVPIRPPTVPSGTSRLRISITRRHTDEDIARLVESLKDWREQVRG